MNVTISGKDKHSIKVGDIIEYESSSHRTHPFYMVCESEKDGFFVMSLTGTKGRMKYYSSLKYLQFNLKGVKEVYSQKEWQLKLDKIN
ncbi:hypothetical protein ACW5UC_24790 [Priestia aryabhattai]|uniref:hypothetical protein n=1 Tax=Priestia megaterium TaxID=1404 RepID=UPI003F973D9D